MGWFFETHPFLDLVRPRFIYPIEYAALTCEIVGLAFSIVNTGYLIVKIRHASATHLLIGLLVASVAVSVMIISHMFMFYLTPTPAALTSTTWSCLTAQIAFVYVEIEAVRIFVPNVDMRLVNALRVVNGAVILACATPSLFRGPILIDMSVQSPLSAWYQATTTVWSSYVNIFDVSTCAFIAWRIYLLSRQSMQSLGNCDNSSVAVSMVNNAAHAKSAASRPQRGPVMAQIHRDFAIRVRITVISLLLFLSIVIFSIFAGLWYYYYLYAPISLENMLYACATVQIGLGVAGPHVAFISVMFYNVGQIVLASQGKLTSRAGSRGSKSGPKSVRTAEKATPPAKTASAVASEI
ncbi:hypothetical protein HK105_206623 [Polyrhizophydium stewartii]|uniref:G protein-coupled receptor n=1 Tax=Polyrhizophydium stewartii TaxID=2732419 RepID=A0ABR4N320_9FUNG